jgi:peptide deformylase
MKPIATLMKPLRSVDLTTLTESGAAIERSDVCAVPAAAVVGEAMVALTLADALVEKFGGDSLSELRRSIDAWNAEGWASACAPQRKPGQTRRRARCSGRSSATVSVPLHAPAEPVSRFDQNFQALIDDMIETMYAAPGIGLAAPQVGVPVRVFVADLSVGRDLSQLIVMVNPEFVEREGTQLQEEGCLSLPGFNATVLRPARAVVRGLDRVGREQRIEGTGLLARAFQHEIDHLDGRLFVDRLRGIKRDVIVRKVQRLQRSGKW